MSERYGLDAHERYLRRRRFQQRKDNGATPACLTRRAGPYWQTQCARCDTRSNRSMLLSVALKEFNAHYPEQCHKHG